MRGVGLVGVGPAALARYEPGSPLVAALTAPGPAEPLGEGEQLPGPAERVTAERFPQGSFDADTGTSGFRVRIIGVLPDGAGADRAIGPVVGEVGEVGTVGGLLVFGGPGAERLPGSANSTARIDADRLKSVVAGSAAVRRAGRSAAARRWRSVTWTGSCGIPR
ncbi:hypothetical protein [Kitasatospora phosalacinea]|uniref:hypothetical protein n=1 Tax=Kitasatospora phosalacinea TaxID=2065 RepID=UPI0005247B4A|nr:hypothetical protein [Kitasatospora phosalacinea]